MGHLHKWKAAMIKIFVLITAFSTIKCQMMMFPDYKDNPDNVQSSLVDMIDDTNRLGDSVVITNAGSTNRRNSFEGVSPYNETKITHGMYNFALNLNKVLLKEQSQTNVVLSPLSIAGALTLLLLGSVGKTYGEIANALGFFNDISESQGVHREFGFLIDKITKKEHGVQNTELPNVNYGSGLFVQQNTPIRPQYEDFVKSIYKSVLMQTDFRNNPNEAQSIINKWVADLTNGRIPEMLSDPPPQNTRIIIATALYFRGQWEKFFLEGVTRRAPFILDKRFPHQTIEIDLMANEGFFPFHRSKELECMIVGLPYKGNNTILYAIKPLDATRKDIAKIVNDLTAESLDNLVKSTKRQSTIVTFPKMRLSSSYNLKTVLKNMGVQSVFSSVDSNLALLSPAQVPSSPYMEEKNLEPNNNQGDFFIFSRSGFEPPKNDCAHLFKTNTSGKSCTTVEVIDNKNVTVVYKQIGDKVGRRIIKRSAKMLRPRRQMAVDMWNPGLYVDEVIHKVDIDITETGTEAAAATAVLITRDGRRPVFAATEPFFFFIRDEDSKFILFSAIVYKPEPNVQ